jgi:hypothetical protein
MLASMGNSRELRDTVVRGMAKVGLVWALFVLGALFMAMSSLGNEPGGYSFNNVGAAQSSALTLQNGQAPSTAGLALALFVLASGITVLAVGGTREPRASVLSVSRAPDNEMDLPLALGLVWSGSTLA